jgi:hypothetical protein
MIPPIEISGRKITVVARRGYFEISQNQIKYKYSSETDFLTLSPQENIGYFTELPSTAGIDSSQLIYNLFRGITEICFLPEEIENGKDAFYNDFIYGDLLPFTQRQFGSGFYRLRQISPLIFEEFYRLTESLEDSLSTTIATFDQNIFIPFKQKVIGTMHTKGEEEEKANVALNILSRDFPRFLGLHRDLQVILNTEASKISEYQQLSLTILSPILRKIRMVKNLRDIMVVEKKKKTTEMRMKPKLIKTSQIANIITPHVQPR